MCIQTSVGFVALEEMIAFTAHKPSHKHSESDNQPHHYNCAPGRGRSKKV